MAGRIGRMSVTAALLMMLVPATALAQSSPTAIRSVVSGQLEAFRAEDFDRAYSFAAPEIRSQFPLDRFVAMVRGGYAPVLGASNVEFGREAVDGRQGFLEVFMTDPEGTAWVALYSLQAQPDGTWKITGCQLTKDSSPRA